MAFGPVNGFVAFVTAGAWLGRLALGSRDQGEKNVKDRCTPTDPDALGFVSPLPEYFHIKCTGIQVYIASNLHCAPTGAVCSNRGTEQYFKRRNIAKALNTTLPF